MDWLLESLAPSLLGPLLEPVRTRVGELLGAQGQERGELARRIRLLPLASRPIANTTFLPVAGALIKRRRLAFCYRTVPRTVSPQRLAHYRDNWYLDAWCHNRNDLRTFALSRIAEPQELHQTADDIPDDQLDAHFAGAYGIFAGRPDKEAVLRFHGEITERIAEETWHPHQRTRWLPDGRYELIVPYYDPRELIRDVLRHGSDVVVVSPLDLREEVSSRHKAAAALYE
jgi:predicted DNA-binding transcriptional regulator YafY